MRTIATFRYLLTICLLSIFSSCQRLVEEDLDVPAHALKVKARSADACDLFFPLHFYAFTDEGACAASQIVNSAEEAIELTLANGEYRVVAIADVSGSYQLPEHPNAADEITLTGVQGADRPLMMGKADVTINGKSTTLTITLSYAVTSISVALKDVPSDVAAVQLSLSPLHSSLLLSGEYSEATYKLDIPCTLDTENIWTANQVYTFPGSGSKTVFSILLTKKDGSQQTYAYTYSGIPEANRPFNISGSYAGSVTVGGEFIVSGWDTSTEVEFAFGAANDSDNSTPETPTSPTDTPEVGTLWNNGVVVEVTDKQVLLMSLDEWECYSGTLPELLEEYAVDGWELPDAAQAKLLNATFQEERLTTLNNRLEKAGYSPIDIDKRYLYDNNGEIFAFGFKPTSQFKAAGTQTKYRVRFVQTISN